MTKHEQKKQILKTSLNTDNEQLRSQKYDEYVSMVTPTKSLPLNMIKAFITGGFICTIGQLISNLLLYMGLDSQVTKSATSMILIGLSVLLTGFGFYSRLGDFAGAGSLVPITGFANSVASSAIEYKKEGQIFGIGCKIFVIAGPVILYGLFFSWLLGILYYILNYLI